MEDIYIHGSKYSQKSCNVRHLNLFRVFVGIFLQHTTFKKCFQIVPCAVLNIKSIFQHRMSLNCKTKSKIKISIILVQVQFQGFLCVFPFVQPWTSSCIGLVNSFPLAFLVRLSNVHTITTTVQLILTA